MQNQTDILAVHVNVDLSARALKAIVENAKSLAGKDHRGRPLVDTAGAVGMMITKFLAEKDFETYVMDPDNYPEPETA